MTNKILKSLMLGALAGSLIFTAKTELTQADTKADIKAGAKTDSMYFQSQRLSLQ